MSTIHSYSKVWALGHPQITELCNEPVLVQEKVDGSQFSWLRTTEDELLFRSKGCPVYPDAAGMFTLAVEELRGLREWLNPGYLYRGEFLSKPRHNALAYGRVPAHYVVVFDIEDMAKGPYHFLTAAEVAAECARIGLECVAPDEETEVRSTADLEAHMQKPSMLGGPREGVVLKNYSRWTVDGKAMMGKYVSEKFKEAHATSWKADKPGKNDVVAFLITKLRTEARYAKAAQHLRERGALTETVQDIGPLIREVQTDVIAEEADTIKEALFQWAKPQIMRGVAAGVPQYWKDVLVAKQFVPYDQLQTPTAPLYFADELATDGSPTTDASPNSEAPQEGAPLATSPPNPATIDSTNVQLATEMGEGD